MTKFHQNPINITNCYYSIYIILPAAIGDSCNIIYLSNVQGEFFNVTHLPYMEHVSSKSQQWTLISKWWVLYKRTDITMITYFQILDRTGFEPANSKIHFKHATNCTAIAVNITEAILWKPLGSCHNNRTYV